MRFNPLKLSVPSSTGLYKQGVEEFKGIDKASGEDNFSPTRATELQNFIRDKVGMVKKRGGFTELDSGLENIEWLDYWNDPHGNHFRIHFDGTKVHFAKKEKGIYASDNKTLGITETLGKLLESGFANAVGYSYENQYVVAAMTKEEIPLVISFDGEFWTWAYNLPCERVKKTVPLITTTAVATISEESTETDETETDNDGTEMDGTVVPSTGTGGPYSTEYSEVYLEMYSDFLPIPCIVAGARPSGGGTTLYSPNLLNPYVTETFIVRPEDYDHTVDNTKICARFQLSLKDITLTYMGRIISSSEWEGGSTGEIKYAVKIKGDDKGIVEEHNDKKPDDVAKHNTNDWSIIDKYWYKGTDGYGHLTRVGELVIQNSLKIEVYYLEKENGVDLYQWKIRTSGCFASGTSWVGKEGYVSTVKGAIWMPNVQITASPVEEEPSVRITYLRNYEDYKAGFKKLLNCKKATCFGVGGYKDRVFLSGDNRIYYSGMDSPLYFGELNYVEPCTANKEIVAMGGEGQVLYAVDSDGITHAISGTVQEDDSATFLSDAAFVIADRVQGEKPVGSVLKIFGGEFCYLSEEGVVAIRHDNFYDKRYAQNRSRMLGDSIKGEIKGATVWGNFLVVATSDKLYLLDELQQTVLKDYKYSGVQYEVYPFTFKDLPGAIQRVWTVEDELHLQTLKDGAYQEFVYDPEALEDSFGQIEAVWVTPYFSLSDTHRLKRIQEFYLAVGAEENVVTVEYQTDTDKEWRLLRDADARFFSFDYGKIDYGMFSYNCKVPKLNLTVRGRPSRPFYKIRFRFSSNEQYALSLSSFGFYYKKEVI